MMEASNTSPTTPKTVVDDRALAVTLAWNSARFRASPWRRGLISVRSFSSASIVLVKSFELSDASETECLTADT